MNAIRFAWRSLVRQPARALLGIIGVAAIGALLFDMLMLSNGLILSMQTMLGRSGFTIRVSSAGAPLPGTGQPIEHATATSTALGTLTGVTAAVPVRYANGRIRRPGQPPVGVSLLAAEDPQQQIWTPIDRDTLLSEPLAGRLLVNRNVARELSLSAGDTVLLSANCGMDVSAAPPMEFTVAGVADFRFDDDNDRTVGATLQNLDYACGGEGIDLADQIMLATDDRIDHDEARMMVDQLNPDLELFTNDQLVAQFQQGSLSYFRQISLVLTTVTIAFAFLLVTVLLTVSVNQRVGEIAALRALGLSQCRVVADVLCESILLVGTGALLAIPVGFVLAGGLDRILKAIPGVPTELHFFVYEPRALLIHSILFSVTAFLAAAYPMRMVARLPIAGTLRREVIG